MSEQRRRRAKIWSLGAGSALAALLAAAPPASPSIPSAASNGTGTVQTGGAGDNGNGKNNGGGNDKKSFTVAGSVTGLYPGATRTLVVTLANPNNFAIRVTSLTTAVADPAGPCDASAVRVAPMAGTVVVPGNGSTVVTLTARMTNDPTDDCQATTFGLTYSGTAVKA